MRSPAEAMRDASRRAYAQGLSPHVDAAWAEDFVFELRLLGVDGTTIGSALSEVESHCGESQERAQQAFGDAGDYARSLQLPTHSDASRAAQVRSVAPTVVEILGMFVVTWGFAAWREGDRLAITAGHVVAVVGFLLGVATLVRFAAPVLRAVVRHPVVLWFGVMASTAAFVVALLFLDGVVVRVAAGWALAAGAAALAGGCAWSVARQVAHGSVDDPVASPLAAVGADPGGTAPGRLPRAVGLGLLNTAVTIPIWTLILLAATWALKK
jgi:hypothetical protein